MSGQARRRIELHQYIIVLAEGKSIDEVKRRFATEIMMMIPSDCNERPCVISQPPEIEKIYDFQGCLSHYKMCMKLKMRGREHRIVS